MKKVYFLSLFILIIIIITAISVAFFFYQKKDNSIVTETKKSLKLLRLAGADDHIIGNIKAPIQIIVYSDFECPFSAQFSETIKEIRNEFKDNVLIVFRHFPLSSHDYAMSAANTSECAAEQGKFWEMHDLLFERNKKNDLGLIQFKEDATAIDLDMELFAKCFDSNKYKNKIQENMLEGRSAGVTGTPTIFINNDIYVGAVPFNDYIDSEGKNSLGIKNIIKNKLKNESF